MGLNRNDTFIPRKNYFGISPGMIRQLLIQHGLSVENVEPIAQTLHRLFTKFATDERLNYDIIEKFMNTPSGAGQRSTTIVIAANDTSTAGKGSADYLCDGTADDVQIQAAVDELDTLPQRGGRIILLEGDYNLSATIDIDVANGVTIEGLGAYATRLNGSDTRATFNMVNGIPRFIGLHLKNGNGAIVWDTVGLGAKVEHCYFESCVEAIRGTVAASAADTFLDYWVSIIDNVFDNCGQVSGSHYAVALNRRLSKCVIANNQFHQNKWAAMTCNTGPQTDESEYIQIVGNHFDITVDIEECVGGCSITGNTFGDDLNVTNVETLAIVGNTVQGTYTETTCIDVSKAGNVGNGF